MSLPASIPCHCWHHPHALGSVLSTIVSKQLDNLGIIQKRTETWTKKQEVRHHQNFPIQWKRNAGDKPRGMRTVHLHPQAWWSPQKNKGITHCDRTGVMILIIEPSEGAHTQRLLSLRQVLMVLLDISQNPIAWQMLGAPQQPFTCWYKKVNWGNHGNQVKRHFSLVSACVPTLTCYHGWIIGCMLT